VLREASARGLEVTLVRNGSRGMVWLEPLVEVETAAGRVGYGPVSAADVGAVLDGSSHKALGPVEELPFFRSQTRLTFARVGLTDPLSLADYSAHGGLAGLEKALAAEFQLQVPAGEWLEQDKQLDPQGLADRVCELARQHYQGKVDQVGAEVMHGYERLVMLSSLDQHWREHLAALDHLRQGIHLRGYAQKNPKQEYKREAFELFATMLDEIKRDVTLTLLNVQIRSEEAVQQAEVGAGGQNGHGVSLKA
jgi:preprotein translocase subunit SecA